MTLIDVTDLERGTFARELVGRDHDDAGVCLLLIDAAPGQGPSPHRHPYAEVFVIQEGTGTFRLGDEQVQAGAGQIVVVPGGVTHCFTSTGPGPLRQVAIHASPEFATEWL
jgi:mannose-6-phosphate isomerase-like protein (cupin superfamily)